MYRCSCRLVTPRRAAPLPKLIPFTYVQLRDQYLRLLKQYLSWSVTRYIPCARQNSTTLANIEVAFADVADVIERRFGRCVSLAIELTARVAVMWVNTAPAPTSPATSNKA